MRSLYLLFVVLFLSIFLLDCKYGNQWKTITVKNKFSMSVPDWMKESDELKPDADFQYCNRFRNIYCVVFSEAKNNNTLADFYARESSRIKRVLTNPAIDDSSAAQVGNAAGLRVELSGKMQGEMIYYSILALEYHQTFYQVCVWTRGEDRKLKYKADLEKLVNSFRLL